MDTAGRSEWHLSRTTRPGGHRRTSSGDRARMAGAQDPGPSGLSSGHIGVMRIVLARHGRPAWDFGTPIPGHALGEWLRGKGEAPLDASSRPSAELERLSKEAKCLVASPLRRSRPTPPPGDVGFARTHGVVLRLVSGRGELQGRSRACGESGVDPDGPRRGVRGGCARGTRVDEHPDRTATPCFGMARSAPPVAATLDLWSL